MASTPIEISPQDRHPPRVFISADHGLAIVYFLQSDVVPTLLEAGVEVVLLTDDALKTQIEARFGCPGMIIEGLRLEQANAYTRQVDPEAQWWLQTLRRVGSSNRINTQAMDSYIDQIAVEEGWKRRLFMPVGRAAIAILRRSRRARQSLVRLQMRYIPGIYSDLFQRYQPSLVVASTPGWRMDRYLLREAVQLGVPTAAVVVGWDNPSSYSIPGAPVEHITCWSQVQKDELVLGSDWPPQKVNIGGIPTYDGYFRKQWQLTKEEYFRLHGLDLNRKLLSYAASFVSFSPNYQNVEALARLVAGDSLSSPSQLLVRLHPNHFWENHLFAAEREKIRQLASDLPHVHVVEPVPLGASLGYYSGEDMPEKASMMAHSDVFLTVYSTMVVETAIHQRPIVSACLDAPGGWNIPRKFSLPLSEIGNWPTHDRFRRSGFGRIAMNVNDLREAINFYLQNPEAEARERQAFIQRECTFTDGSSGRRTGEYLLSLIDHEGMKK
jgi:CDP-Glycerol:Poly(glycerophosphate) glycerophosphotransferase